MSALPHDRGDDAVGFPYAAAVVDERGYALVCPRCGARCAAEGTIGEATLEDDVTKGAALAYALHFEQAEREEHSPPCAPFTVAKRPEGLRRLDHPS